MPLENEQELINAMEELRRQMQGLGTDTAKADNELTKFAKNATALGREVGSAASQLASGGGAFKSMNGVVDLTTKAIGGLLNIIPGVGGALKELAGAAGDAAKFVLQQFDDLAKNYQALGESSAIATDGIDGLQRQFRQMGLMTLPAFTKAINQNTIGFTALSGSVARGAEEFSNLAGAMTQGDTAEGFLKLGMSFDQIGESSAKYVASFARYGLLQGKTFEELRASTQNYLLEVDQIARITGNTRKQQEEEQQKSLANVRFRAKIETMRAEGQAEQAAELEKYVNGLTGPMADAARATLTGIPLTEEAAMANIAMGNAISENLIAIQNGAKATTALAKTQQAAAEGTKQWSPLWQYTGDIAGGVAIQMLDQAAIVRRQNEIMEKENVTAEEAAKRAQEELIAAKGSTQGFVDAQKSVAGSAKDLQNLSFTLVKSVTPAVDAFASALKKVTGYIDQKFGGTPSATPASMGGPGAGRLDYGKSLYGKPEAEKITRPDATQTKDTAKPTAEKITRPDATQTKDTAKPTAEKITRPDATQTKDTAKPTTEKPTGPATQSQKEFMDTMYKTLLAEATKQGVKNPEIIAKLGTAQSALETGYGRSLAGGQNYFGIKARPGEGGAGVATQEFINGKMVTVQDKFRKYGSMQESAADYVKFLSENKRYKGVLGAGTLSEAIQEQGRTGYATDPKYAEKLSKIAGQIQDQTKNIASSPESSLAGPVSGYKTGGTVDPTMTLTKETVSLTAPSETQNREQISFLAQINETLEKLNRTAQSQVDVSTKIYQASV